MEGMSLISYDADNVRSILPFYFERQVHTGETHIMFCFTGSKDNKNFPQVILHI